MIKTRVLSAVIYSFFFDHIRIFQNSEASCIYIDTNKGSR